MPVLDPEFYTHVGDRIRQRRRGLGLRQADLAAALGVSFQQVHKYEAGLSEIPASRLWLISRTLNIPVASLLPS